MISLREISLFKKTDTKKDRITSETFLYDYDIAHALLHRLLPYCD